MSDFEPKKKRGRGRPTRKTPSVVAKILDLAKKGKTTAQIAEIVGVGRRTIEGWMVQDFEFAAHLKELRQEADEMVEASLYKRATGYSHQEEKLFFDSKSGTVVRAETVMHYPPDPTSMIFWLKNRQRDKWKDKHDHELAGKDGEPLKLVVEDYRKGESK